MRKSTLVALVGGLVIILVAVAAGILLLRHPRAAAPAATANSCITQVFGTGNSGHCVSDIQTMVNFMETDSLTECQFANGKQLTVNGQYDTSTQQQVTDVQSWNACYAKEEGLTPPMVTPGEVGSPTWSELCNFAYHYPSQSKSHVSPFTNASLAAGKDAGC